MDTDENGIFRPPRISLVMLFWHPVSITMSAFNWLYFLSDETSMLGTVLPRAHVAFNVLGGVVYILLASVLLFWPYRYGSFMLGKTRRNRLLLGSIFVYFTHVLPCWMMEFSVIWSYGWFNVLQGASFIMLTIAFIVDSLLVWFAYIWQMGGFMQVNYGNTVFGRGSFQ